MGVFCVHKPGFLMPAHICTQMLDFHRSGQFLCSVSVLINVLYSGNEKLFVARFLLSADKIIRSEIC